MNYSSSNKSRGYTLIEALVASSILMIGVGAAASLSLTMVTQEEINERSVRALNYLENAATLYQLSVDTPEAILPGEEVVDSLVFTQKTETVAGFRDVEVHEIKMTYSPTTATKAWTAGSWTNGEKDITRTQSVKVFRSKKHL